MATKPKKKRDGSVEMYDIFTGDSATKKVNPNATPGAGRGKGLQEDGMGRMIGQMNDQTNRSFSDANNAGLLGGIRQSPRNNDGGLDGLGKDNFRMRTDQEQLQRIVDSHANTAGRRMIQQNPQLAEERAKGWLGMEQDGGQQSAVAAPAPADSGFRFFEQGAPVGGVEPVNVGQAPFAPMGGNVGQTPPSPSAPAATPQGYVPQALDSLGSNVTQGLDNAFGGGTTEGIFNTMNPALNQMQSQQQMANQLVTSPMQTLIDSLFGGGTTQQTQELANSLVMGPGGTVLDLLRGPQPNGAAVGARAGQNVGNRPVDSDPYQAQGGSPRVTPRLGTPQRKDMDLDGRDKSLAWLFNSY
jgi:hypothetical protein